MGSGIRLLIDYCLKALEQGRFQEFCQSFLPLYDQRYEGLIRHGGTAEGKTRPGTPDLIKTNQNGSQIAVQCSVDKDYWKKPNDQGNIDSMKPCQDIIKCVRELKKVHEIVLCSNQEIPTNHANAPSEIIEHAKSLTNAKITIISLAFIESELDCNREKYNNIFRSYLNEVYQYTVKHNAFQNAEVILSSYKRLPLSLEKIEEIVKELTPEEVRDRDVVEVVIERGSILGSRFQRKILPYDQLIIRDYDIQYFDGDPFGRVISVLGVPKIGKTSLIAQISKDLQEKGIEVLWFDPPINENEINDFYDELKRVLLGKLVSPQAANEYADCKLSQEDLIGLLSTHNCDRRYVVVIDDYHIIPNNTAKQLDRLIELINSSDLKESVGFVLITNKSLEKKAKCIKKEYKCPNWNQDEIEMLLNATKISIPEPVQAYCNLLTVMSGGHPLIAVALARKKPTFNELLLSREVGYPELHDEELTQEVKELLFEDILAEHDLRQFILRLSVLIYKHDFSILELLSAKVDPPLQTPIKLIIEKLKSTVLEGDESTGYQVAFVFKNLTKTYVTEDQQRDIVEKVSISLLTPENNIFDVVKVIQGIDYSLLNKNYGRAFQYAFLLIYNVSEKTSDNVKIKYVLDNLLLIRSIDFPKDNILKFMYTIVLTNMALAYIKIKDHDKSIDILHKILSNKIDKTAIPAELVKGMNLESYYNFIFTQLIYNLAQLEQYNEAIEIIKNIHPTLVISSELTTHLNPLEIINTIITKVDVSDFPEDLFLSIVKLIDIKRHKKELALLMTCFQSLGLACSKHDAATRKKVIDALAAKSDYPLWEFLIILAEIQSLVETGIIEECIGKIQNILASSSHIAKESNIIQSRLLTQKADAYLKTGDKISAVKYYKESIKVLDIDNKYDQFTYAICNYNLGLSTDNNDIALKAFSEASNYFKKQGYINLQARSDGEKAVIHCQNQEYGKAVRLIEYLTDKYYFDSVLEYAPAVTLGLSLLTRIRHELCHEKLANEEDYPKAERGVFERIVDFAKPHPSISSAFYVISEIYRLINDKKNQKRTLEKALSNTSNSPLDSNAHLLSLDCLIDLLLENRQFDDIKDALVNFFKSFDKIRAKENEISSVIAVLRKNDELIENRSIAVVDYDRLLSCVEDALIEKGEVIDSYMLAEIYRRKAGINGITQENDYDIKILKKAWEYSLDGNNLRCLLQTGQLLGFNLFNKSIASIQELAKIHLSIILANCNLNENNELKENNLNITGSNMFMLWNVIKYTGSKESDYPYIINLKHRAENMKQNNIPAELHSPVMILNLLKICGVTQDPKYKLASDWSLSIIKERFDELPKSERDYLKDLVE